jgi:integrase
VLRLRRLAKPVGDLASELASLRIGEVLGLRWQDIDFDQGYLYVRSQLSPKRELARLKTKAARRDVVLGAPLAKLLKGAQARLSLLSGEVDFVFPAPDGRGRDQRSSSRGIDRALERTKLGGQGFSAHAFRHTFAALLIVGMKRDVVHVAGQLGHSNPSTTLRIYAHMFDKARHAEDTRAARKRGGRGSRPMQKAPFPGPSRERMMGLEPTTFCMASRRSSQLSYIREGSQYSRG